MKANIIPEDGTVWADGVLYEGDLSTVDRNIHAIHIDGANVEIEYKDFIEVHIPVRRFRERKERVRDPKTQKVALVDKSDYVDATEKTKVREEVMALSEFQSRFGAVMSAIEGVMNQPPPPPDTRTPLEKAKARIDRDPAFQALMESLGADRADVEARLAAKL